MGMTAALMALDGVERLEKVVAIELLCGCQALDCDPGAPGAAVASLYDAVRERVAPLVEDRPPADDLVAAHGLVAQGLPASILDAALD